MPETPPTGEYHHIPIRDRSEFISSTFRTITLLKTSGRKILAVVGKLKNGNGKMKIQKYLFQKKSEENPKGWTMAEAKAWVAEHKREVDRNYNVRESRTVSLDIELKEERDRSVVVGYANIFDDIAVIGDWFQEQFKRGAFKKTIKESQQIATWNHNPSNLLGRTDNETLSLHEDEVGLRAEITLPDTTLGRDVLSLVRDSYVDGMSMTFVAMDEVWDNNKKPPLRTVRQARLFEVALVTEPAFPGTFVLDARGVYELAHADVEYDEEPPEEHVEDTPRLAELSDEDLRSYELLRAAIIGRRF